MNQEKRAELIRKHPSLKNSSNWQVVEPSKIEKYKSSEKIRVISPAGPYKRITVSENLLKEIATNPQIFFTLKKFFENQENTNFSFCCEDKHALSSFPITRYELLKGLEALSKQEDNPDSAAYQAALESFKEISSVEDLNQMYGERTFNLTVDGKKVELPFQELLSLLTMPQKEYNGFIKNFNASEHNGLSLEEYLYSFTMFIENEDVFLKAYFDDKQIQRFENIFAFNVVDFQSINELTETNNPLLPETFVSPELHQAVLGKMPEQYDDLQKAQYIYLKMCQLLTYDTEFYAVHQTGPKAEKHKSINYVKGITPDNNQAVCYEFSAIYGKLLELSTQNLTQELIYKNAFFGKGVYGEHHTSIDFRAGKYLASADSLIGILCSDLTQVKSGRDVTGLVCKNICMETKEDFFVSLDEVKADLKQQLVEETKGELPTTYRQMQELYEETLEYKPGVSLKEKLDFIADQIQSTQLEGMDAFSYLLQLRKTVFTKKEQNENIFINLVREDNFEQPDSTQTTAIITLSKNYREKDCDCDYLVYRPNDGLSEISKEDLCEAFNSATFSYITVVDEEIPGINAPVCKEFMLNTPEYN